MRIALFTIALLVGSFVTRSQAVVAEPAFVVIVNAKNNARSLDRQTVADMFLKKRTQWGNEMVIMPVDLKRDSAVRKQFSERVIGRSIASVRTYWNRLVFSGRGVPPPELASDDDVVKYVAKHPGAIGYVSSATGLKDAPVKILEVR